MRMGLRRSAYGGQTSPMAENTYRPAADGTARVGAPQPGCASKTVNAEQLFAGTIEIVISHNGERYRLRRTSKGKLILTK